METPPNEDAGKDSGSDEQLIDQSAIDALLGGDVGAQAAPAPSEPAAAPVGEASADSSQAEIDALLASAGDADSATDTPVAESAPDAAEPEGRVDTLGRPFDEAAAAMQAVIEEEQRAAQQAAAGAPPPPATTLQPAASLPTQSYDLIEFNGALPPNVDAKRVTMLNDVNLRVKIQLGRTRMLVEDVLKLGEGSVVELDKLAGDPVDVLVNDRLVARGEVLVLNDNFCVRVSEVISRDPHRITE